MGSTPTNHRSDVLDPDATPLPEQEEARRRYYEGSQVPSPVGGVLDPIGVRYGGPDEGTVLFECLSSSLRFTLTIPPATRTERRRVREALSGELDPHCPRHGLQVRLVRNDRDLVCPKCGVRYARVG